MRRLSGTSGRPLARGFYDRPVLTVARALLGRLLVYEGPEARISGRIVECEAYRGQRDPASHAFRGRTPRNAVMFGPPGFSYVYFIYGVHHCLNVVAEREGSAAAILLRALEPVEGMDAMRARRGSSTAHQLARGPGCVAAALGLTRAHCGLDLTRGPLWVSDLPPRRRGLETQCGPRVGVRNGTEEPWRFWLAGHPCVSGRAGGGVDSKNATTRVSGDRAVRR